MIYFITFFLMPVLAFAAEEHAGEHSGNPSPGVDLLFREINFFILLAILFFLLRKPVKEFFAARSAALKLAVDEAKKVNTEAKIQHEEISRRLKNVDHETESLVESFRKDGELERAKLLDQARQYAEKIKEDAKKIADNELKRAREELKETAVQIAKDLAGKTIEREITDADQDRLTKNYVERLDKL